MFQVGFAANTHGLEFGAFAPLNVVLADDGGHPGLPAGPFAGEVSDILFDLNSAASFPTPSPDLTGTWDGSIDCAGIADFTDAESFSGPVVLEVGARFGLNYSVELSDGGGVIATYCAEYTNDLQLNGNQGTGRMISADPAQPPATVFLKARNNPDPDPATLKGRELIHIPDGLDDDGFPDGLNLCKWSFTQTGTAAPGGAPVGCPFTVCGDGVVEVTEECDDGNTVDGDGCSAICQIEF